MSAPKGRCVICNRDNVAIVGRGHCSACYSVGKSFNWDSEKTKEFRRTNPVGRQGARHTKLPGITGAIKVKRKYTKKIKFPIPASSPLGLFPGKFIPPADKDSGFPELIVRAFAAIEAKEKVCSILCSQIKELEQKLITTKQDLIKSRYEVRTLMREKLTSVEISGGGGGQ